jgi:PBSX family phage terminase large subunit
MKSKWSNVLSPRQIEVSKDIKENDPIHVILEGAVRSGKTFLGVMYWVSLLKKHENELFIMTGQTISSLKRNVLDEITKAFGIETHLNMSNEWFFNKNKIVCFGSDKADSFKAMRGLTASGWYANEVILSHQNSILEAFARCSKKDKKIIWETNPDKPSHYIKTHYINRSGEKLEDGSINIMSYHFTIDDNVFLDSNYVEGLKKAIPKGTIYDRQILGLWRATEQSVYNNYDIVANVPDESKIDDICYGLDFGYNNPCALIKAMYVDGEIYLDGLMCKTKLTNAGLVAEIKKLITDKRQPIYCDNAEPDKIADLRNAGFNAIGAKKDVIAGINKVKEYKLHIVNNDSVLKYEMENYEFKKNGSGEVTDEPVKLHDHYMDAMRYAIYTNAKGNFGTVEKQVHIKEISSNYQF